MLPVYKNDILLQGCFCFYNPLASWPRIKHHWPRMILEMMDAERKTRNISLGFLSLCSVVVFQGVFWSMLSRSDILAHIWYFSGWLLSLSFLIFQCGYNHVLCCSEVYIRSFLRCCLCLIWIQNCQIMMYYSKNPCPLRIHQIPNQVTIGRQEPKGQRPSGSWAPVVAELGINADSQRVGALAFIPWRRQNSYGKGVCGNVWFLHGCPDVSYRSWNENKNPCPYRNHTFPNSAHHQNLESSQPAALCFPGPDDASRWEMCDFRMGMGSYYIIPWPIGMRLLGVWKSHNSQHPLSPLILTLVMG